MLTCTISLGKNRYCQTASGPAWPTLIPGLCLEKLGFSLEHFGFVPLDGSELQASPISQPVRLWEVKKQSTQILESVPSPVQLSLATFHLFSSLLSVVVGPHLTRKTRKKKFILYCH